MITIGTNSYISVADANAYFNECLYSDLWTAASDDDKEKALIMATKRIDRLAFKGRKAYANQALKFPRAFYSPEKINDLDFYNKEYEWFVEKDISQAVKDAVCEEALALLKGLPKRLELQAQGVKSFTMDKLSETYTGERIKILSPDARELLRPYMVGSAVIV